MSSIVVAGDTSGTVTLSAPAVAGSSVLTLPASTGTVTATASAVSAVGQIPFSTDGSTWSSTAKIVSGTAVASTSGTSIDFTGIPSWVKRVTVMFNGVSTSGTSFPQVQLGTLSGGIENSGYIGSTGVIANTGTAIATQLSSGVLIDCAAIYYLATSTRQGSIVFNLLGSNTWTFSGVLGAVSSVQPIVAWTGGSKTTSGALDRVRITTVNGTDLFDAGSINIMYE